MKHLGALVAGLLLVCSPALAQKLQPSTGILLTAPTDGAGNVCTTGSPCTNTGGGGGGGGAVTITQSAVTATARGITLTTGGTDQTIAAANASRKGLVIQNPCSLTTQGIAAAESVFVNINAAATVTGNGNFAELGPCQSVTLTITPGQVDQEAVHVNAATTGHVIYAKEF